MNADLAALHELEQTILNLTKLMVDDPDTVPLEVLSKPTETLLRLHVTSAAAAHLIGKQGLCVAKMSSPSVFIDLQSRLELRIPSAPNR